MEPVIERERGRNNISVFNGISGNCLRRVEVADHRADVEAAAAAAAAFHLIALFAAAFANLSLGFGRSSRIYLGGAFAKLIR